MTISVGWTAMDRRVGTFTKSREDRAAHDTECTFRVCSEIERQEFLGFVIFFGFVGS